jgi:hypothetical protein
MPAGDESRSEGFPVASLSGDQQVALYRASIGAAFDVSPNLELLLHPRHLPSGAGFDGGTNVPDSLYGGLRGQGVVGGRCDPRIGGNALRAPTCDHTPSGYVVRGSEIFQRSADTLQFYLLSELFATATGPGMDAFAFEMAYKLVPAGEGYRVVAEGRVRQIGRKGGN